MIPVIGQLGYIALTAFVLTVLVAVLVAVLLTFVMRLGEVPYGKDETVAIDYFADQDDPRVQAYDPDPFEDHTHDEVESSGKHPTHDLTCDRQERRRSGADAPLLRHVCAIRSGVGTLAVVGTLALARTTLTTALAHGLLLNVVQWPGGPGKLRQSPTPAPGGRNHLTFTAGHPVRTSVQGCVTHGIIKDCARPSA